MFQHGNLETEENEENSTRGTIAPVKRGRDVIDITMECGKYNDGKKNIEL
jgi:hypothetical protein